MNGTLSKVLIFVAGVGIGSFATWKYVKTKYEAIANSEIEEIREYYRGISSEKDDKDKADAPVNVSEERANYCNAIKDLGYSEDVKPVKRPYVITPEEFDTLDGYDTVDLTYYADGVLADGMDVIENVDQIIGEDSLDRIGEYEDDAVHVRNDEMACDYEILVDLRNYYDVYPPSQGA